VLTGGVDVSAKHGYIVIETNYRLYAYTQSTLQLSIISTFADIQARFDNMAVAVLTRESVRRALGVGIRADQIIDFLREHAHAQMRASGGELVPPTVADQLRLWEMERDRFTFQPATAYSQFDSDDAYRQLHTFTKENDMQLWCRDEARMIIVSENDHVAVREYWKSAKKVKS